MGGVAVPGALAGAASGGERGDAAAGGIFGGDAGAVAFARAKHADTASCGERGVDVQSSGIAIGECFGNQLDAERGESAAAGASANEDGAADCGAGNGERQQCEARAAVCTAQQRAILPGCAHERGGIAEGTGERSGSAEGAVAGGADGPQCGGAHEGAGCAERGEAG